MPKDPLKNRGFKASKYKRRKKKQSARALQKKRVINGSNSRFFIESNERERERETEERFTPSFLVDLCVSS